MTHDEAVARAASFDEEIRRRADDIEAARRLPDDLAARMADAGLFRMLVPQAFGGGQVHPRTLFDAVRATSAADGAVGWCHMIGATTGLLAASLSEDWARRIYADRPDCISAGVTAPLGRAIPVDGGYRVTGRWPFGSACHVAHWLCGGCIVARERDPNDEGAAPDVLLAMFPATSVTIHDTWHTSGLCGTGSNDIGVEDEFVPADRCVVLGSQARVGAALYRFPMLGLLALGVSAVSLGIAERALAEFVDLAASKTPTGSRRTLAARSGTQSDLARARALVASACAYTHDVIDRAWKRAEREGRLGRDVKAELRLAATNNAWSAAEAVDLVYHAAGGSSIYRSSVLQRCFRDAHVATQHIMVAKLTYEVVGKVMLGIDPRTLL